MTLAQLAESKKRQLLGEKRRLKEHWSTAKPSNRTKATTSGMFPPAGPAKPENISRTGTDPWPDNLPKKSYACSGSRTSTPN